jgi:ribosomal protein S18 acetylase RimI-like enzyme
MNEASHARLAEIAPLLELSPGITVRAWQPEDFARVRQLAVDEGWVSYRDRPEALLAAWQGSWPALVAIDQGEVAAFVRAITDGAMSMYVADIIVKPDHRHQGVASALIYACHLLYPEVRLDLLSEESAKGFYSRLGFRPFQGFRKSHLEFGGS